MRAGISLAVILFCAPAWCAEQGPAFSAAQAARGHEAYTLRCTMCHGENLDDGDFGGAPLRGTWFREHWGSGSVATLFSYVQTQMPPDNPGGLNDTTYADILAFILQRNGYPAGDAELPSQMDAMEPMTLEK
jgi:mono/diheme cytochrome c family protein